MVWRANLKPDDASIMRCAVARRCIQLGYQTTSDGTLYLNAVDLASFGDDALFRDVRSQTSYRDMKLGRCLQLPEFAPYFVVVQSKPNPLVILQLHALVPSPSTSEKALLSKLSSAGTPMANGSSQPYLGRLPTPQPAATASASSSAGVQRQDPAKVSNPLGLTACQAHTCPVRCTCASWLHIYLFMLPVAHMLPCQ